MNLVSLHLSRNRAYCAIWLLRINRFGMGRSRGTGRPSGRSSPYSLNVRLTVLLGRSTNGRTMHRDHHGQLSPASNIHFQLSKGIYQLLSYLIVLLLRGGRSRTGSLAGCVHCRWSPVPGVHCIHIERTLIRRLERATVQCWRSFRSMYLS